MVAFEKQTSGKKTKCSSIPPLRENRMRVIGSKTKAELDAKTRDAKAKAQLLETKLDCLYFGRPDIDATT